MASLENGFPLKRPPSLLSSSSSTNGRLFMQRSRSRITRFFLLEKLDYVLWIWTAATFFFVIILFQAFLPSSVVDKSGNSGQEVAEVTTASRVLGELDFGEGIKFIPYNLMSILERKRERHYNSSVIGPPGKRAAYIRPKIALVVADLSLNDAFQLQIVSISIALKEIGYDIEVYAFQDSHAPSIWFKLGFPIKIISTENSTTDWLNYHGVVVYSLEAKPVISCLSPEPFRSLPVIWIIHEKSLALRLNRYATTNKTQIINEWKQAFGRPTVVVFPTHSLAMMYSLLDRGNFYVIPGLPVEAWSASKQLALYDRKDPRFEMGFESEDFIIAIVGSQFSYSGMFLEHALVLQSLAPVLHEFSSVSRVKVGILSQNPNNPPDSSLEVIALKFGFLKDNIYHIGSDGNFGNFLGVSDVVIYGSFLEEEHFPSILVQAMCLGKLVIAPNLAMITKHVDDGRNGYLFPKENLGMLTLILTQAISNGKLSYSAQNLASASKDLGKNLMVSESIESYALLLQNVVRFPSEVSKPKSIGEIPSNLKDEWQWGVLENTTNNNHLSSIKSEIGCIVDKIEEKWSLNQSKISTNISQMEDEAFFSINWAEVRANEKIKARKRLLDEELKDRTDQFHGTWEDVYRTVRRAERNKKSLHNINDWELERTGQALCIYEPYFGEGTWPFLHSRTALYRGIGFTNKGRRPEEDDIDASSRLPILNSGYYRDALGEHGAFYAIANHVDRIHKNAWIGFQSWRLAARKVSLKKKAEDTLLEAIESRKYGDALYFWARMDTDTRNPLGYDFWSFCDALNAGNCRFAVSRALRKMYGMPLEWNSIPPMPSEGNSWSVMHSWAMPTRSFLEFVMFSRMFVDALDSEMFEEHGQSGQCYLSLTRDRRCYSRVLELLVNIWAYHSARRMVYIHPETGAMEEHHKLNSRRGQMWIKFFSLSTLKTMDEDLAEEFDSYNQSRKRWLWPRTGEVFWHGTIEKERKLRLSLRDKKKKESKDKIKRIKGRAQQKPLGKYIKPIPRLYSYNRTNTNTTNGF